MHMTFVVLTAMAIITGATAINSEPTSISTKTSNGGVHLTLDDDKDKRFLRSNQIPKDNNGLKQDSEERLDSTALEKLLRGYTTHKFKLWKRK
ncbi:Putative RxLR effector [Phytophthora palmivora]|uniref:RxLR effector protein n=1 Tax=Phytophthora palmivora TaxID=4796 RepID=A0A2P4XGM3_9STRA|nr:Putative RxLR effector [Phytophthora palmivora]